MKNLKKVLALVLVVATLMGLGLSASAKTFTDSAKVTNKQAVDVMSATGVIGGMPDGSFNPEGNVTRAQMAKIVSAVLNGGTDIGNLYASANVFSDCVNHWAKSYIAYASNLKIVSGVGAGKFDPEGNVTGVAAAKMMLVALGYDPAVEIYTGKDWVANVMADAKDAGLLKGMPKSFDYSKPLSRDNAAQMAFNALKANMVDYETKGTDINIGDTSINVGASKATPKTSSEDWAKNINDDKNATTNLYTVQLGEQVFDNLVLKTSNPDAFGRPASTWTIDRKDIGTYANAADLTYTDEIKAGVLYSDLGKFTKKDTEVTYVVDGASSVSTTANSPAAKLKTDLATGNTTVYGGKGATTAVFYDSNKDTLVVAVINTYLGKINSFTAAKNDKEAFISLTLENKPAGTMDSQTFETTAYTKDDKDTFVLYTAAKNDSNKYEIKEVVKAETVRGKLTAYSSSKNTLTVDGKVYNYSATLSANDKDYIAKGLKDTVDLYLDIAGNVIGIKQNTAEAKDYAVILGLKADSGFGTTNSAQLLLTDGTVKVVSLGSKGTVSGSGSSAEYKVGTPVVTFKIGDIVSYTDDGDNIFRLGQKAVKDTVTGADPSVVISKKGNNSITVKGNTNGTKTYYANSNTIYVIHTVDSNNDNTYEVYTGYNNVPGLTVTKTNTADVTVYEDDNIASVVYVKGATASTASNNFVFVSEKSYAIGADSTRGDYTVYEAVVDGKIVEEFYVAGTGIAGLDANPLLKGYTTNPKGVVTSFDKAESADFTKATGIKSASNDVVTIGTKTLAYAKDVKVFYADEDGVLTDVGITGITEDTTDIVFYTMDDGQVNNIYIVYAD